MINDAYNANPDSMRAALEHLAERAGDRRRVAVLGEMAELGAESDRYHGEIGELAARLRVEVIEVGSPLAPQTLSPGRRTRRRRSKQRATLRPGDAVLVKASRAGARRHRNGDRELRSSMVPVLIAGLLAMVAAVVIGPKFIEVLRPEPRPADPGGGARRRTS